MSMDLEVWSVCPFDLPHSLPKADSWSAEGNDWVYDGVAWQILVVPSEDQPRESVARRLPGACHVAYVTLEPIGAEASAYILLQEVTRSLARQTGGVWVDPSGMAYSHDEGAF